ncbi:hypothetical protein D3C79_683930 [compost metagenome]
MLVSKVTIHRKPDIPVSTRQPRYRDEGIDANLAIHLVLLQVTTDFQGLRRVQFVEATVDQVSLGMHQDLSSAIDQIGIAFALQVDAADDLDQRIDRHSRAHRPKRLAGTHHRGSGGHDHFLGSGIDIRLSEDAVVARLHTLVPIALASIITGGHILLRANAETAVGPRQVHHVEGVFQHILAESLLDGGFAGISGQALCQAFHQQHSPAKPVVNAVGGQGANLAQLALQLSGQQALLPDVVVQGERSEGADHDQGSGQQNLVAEFHHQGSKKGRAVNPARPNTLYAIRGPRSARTRMQAESQATRPPRYSSLTCGSYISSRALPVNATLPIDST